MPPNVNVLCQLIYNYCNRIARICNQQKQAAKIAGEQSGLLFLALFLQEPVESDAAVIDVKDRSMDVVVKVFGVVLRVYTDVSFFIYSKSL